MPQITTNSEPNRGFRTGGLKSRPYFQTIVVFAFIAATSFMPAIAGELEDAFSKAEETSKSTVDHTVWDKLLKAYVKPAPDGLNMVDYAGFKKNGRPTLTNYLKALQAVDVAKLNRQEQFAFWVNLYNAKTIDIVLDHYPVASIKDIDISPGLFADGPWGKKVVKVKGIELSLDDIEHKILRGFWQEPRVHYAVNCASIGCPNLAIDAYTGANLNEMLDKGARAYVNHPRGVRIKGKDEIEASKIYKWFRKDFGKSEENILKHIRRYANPQLSKRIEAVTDIDDYEYDWQLNDTGS